MRTKHSLPSLARSRRFQQALGKRLKVLDRDLPAVLEHDAEALHRTRVASRRLREVLPLIQAGGEARFARKNRGRVRDLTAALGGVRELDVALALLDEMASGEPALAAVVTAVRQEIQRERAIRYANMIRSLEDVKPRKLSRDLASLAHATDLSSGAEQHRRLRERVLRRARQLDVAIEDAGALYAFDRLHLVRIAAKKLRYALELVQELTRVGTARLVSRLRHVQDLLGRLHDLEVLAASVRRVSAGPAAPPAGDVARLLDRIADETRELHASYLARVGTLTMVTAACREQVAIRLR